MHTEHTLLYLIVIIAAARLAGELVERFNQPGVLGELLVGVLLSLTPMRAAAQDPAIVFIGTIGIILLLFEIGLESEFTDLLKVGKSAALVAIIGVALPLLAGTALMYALRGEFHQALFVGATLTATSIGITTRVLGDMGKMQSTAARIILGAAVIDDVLGLLTLGIVQQIASNSKGGMLGLVGSLLLALAFLGAAVWIGIRFAPRLTSFVQGLRTRGVIVSMSVLFCLVLAYAAERLGLAEIIGAFAAGLVLATTDDRCKIQEQVRPVTSLFIPVFFVLVGLQVNLAELNPFAGPNGLVVMGIGLALLTVAIAGKLASGLGVITRGVNRLVVGVGMIPRGEVGLIFASVGLQAGVVSPRLYAELVMVVFVTTLITPLWLKRIRNW